MNLNTNFVCLASLTVASAARVNQVPHSTLLARSCEHATTSDSTAGMSIRVEPRRALNDYLQVPAFAIRSGQPDSIVADAVRDLHAFRSLPPGLYRLRVRSLGYEAAIDTLRLAPGKLCDVTARLVAARPLTPVGP